MPGPGKALVPLLLNPSSGLRELVTKLDPSAASGLEEFSQQFGALREGLDRNVEEQLAAAGVPSVQPAIDAGLLSLLPFESKDDFSSDYIGALWSVLRDPKYYPLFDTQIAELVNTAVREGVLDPSQHVRSRGKQAGAASGFLARLPTFPTASMDEIVDIRGELDRPLVRFRAEMANLAHELKPDSFAPDFDEAAEVAWTARVRPALLELEELVEEKRLRVQFGTKLAGSGGAFGAAGGLVAALVTHAALATGGIATGAMAVAVATGIAVDRAKLGREIQKRPYYLLHRTEALLKER
jgi:hypothetical protein